jgi:protein kinase X
MNETPEERIVSSSSKGCSIPLNERGMGDAHEAAHRDPDLEYSPGSSRLDYGIIDDFELGRTCGTGCFSRVRLARFLPTGEMVALKSVKKATALRLNQAAHMVSERQILRSISHPFIVSLHGTFQSPSRLYFALEYAPGGEFFTYIRRSTRLPEVSAKFYTAQIVSIFEYLHARKIVYRDLKPENLLIASDGYLKLTDFGFAKVVKTFTYTLCGTPEYIAPEVLLNQGHSTPVDWWSLGILIYEMLCGYPPFIADTTIGIYRKVIAGKLYIPRHISKDARYLIRHFLTADLTRRLGNWKGGVDDVKYSAWLGCIEWEQLYLKQLVPPYVPPCVQDTSNFNMYPESDGEEGSGQNESDDLFDSW